MIIIFRQKVTKLQKLVIRTTNVKIRNRKYRLEARDNGFHYVHLDADFSNRNLRDRRSRIAAKLNLVVNGNQWLHFSQNSLLFNRYVNCTVLNVLVEN